MTETIGTLNLKITRLERLLNLLKQQQRLSQPYPEHHLNLIRQRERVEAQLAQLTHARDMLIQPVEGAVAQEEVRWYLEKTVVALAYS